jgi:hypothetical protein
VALNREWHLANPMPTRATFEQRMDWHEQHAKVCHCREMPPSIREALDHRANQRQ